MLKPLKYEPLTKTQIMEMLDDFLYERITTDFTRRLNELIDKNSLLIASSHKSFSYKGKRYSNDTNRFPVKANSLVEQLHPSMNEYLEELKAVVHEKLYTVGYVKQVLNSSNNPNDYLRLLPSFMHRPIQDLINTCPCRNHSLSADKVKEINDKNIEPLSLIKQRMVKNLLV